MASPREHGQQPVEEAAGDQQEYTTVLTDPVNFNVKHPLFSSWTLWYDHGGKRLTSAQSWEQNLKELITFDTVEDFWGVYNNIAKANELQSGANYHLFKKGIRPMWEDTANARGGKWVFQLQKQRGADINDYWLYTMLACIGESFEYEDEICGAVVSLRKGFSRLALWTRSCGPREMTEHIGRQFKGLVGLNMQIEFQPHSDASKSGAHGKDKYVV
ncbi:eukaryotic translation initiation factor 4E-1 [Thamnocephalis sphaerospora]|uniref:Eukaryotic translation initiation factor 4E-1 n=1 Tax=Thamnocephalis sphaerospora TaxID=78915 RepID=A0A4P9XQZ0_9FUNG|nr:eukaryotic translation initiation factor 4E-1 [Thamnocephalis sphaerospora]|eukprot:RKP08483.1 eukaryotic translation initiation factor 4E-1 [Thamnocephalis sphaerospora]